MREAGGVGAVKEWHYVQEHGHGRAVVVTE